MIIVIFATSKKNLDARSYNINYDKTENGKHTANTSSLFRFVCIMLAEGSQGASNAKKLKRKHINLDSYDPHSAFQKNLET